MVLIARLAGPLAFLAFVTTYPAAAAWPGPVNNSCMDKATAVPDGPRLFDCPAFVIKSTDDTWHARNFTKTLAAIDRYFTEDWQSVRAFGTVIDGRAGLRSFMKDWLGGFPDVNIRVSDLFCAGNDLDGYKTTMPYVLTATNSGPSQYGPATGRRVQYHGIANCYIKRQPDGLWRYTSEWDVPDMWRCVEISNQPPHQPQGTDDGGDGHRSHDMWKKMRACACCMFDCLECHVCYSTRLQLYQGAHSHGQ